MASEEIDWVHQKAGTKEFEIASDEHMEIFKLYEINKDESRTLLQTAENPLDFDDFIKNYTKKKK